MIEPEEDWAELDDIQAAIEIGSSYLDQLLEDK